MNGKYLLIPICLLLIAMYLICGLLVRLRMLRRAVNLRIWNSILLITFLITGILGILMAVQTNYKLEWPMVKTLLKWHVDFGFAMSLIALIHLFRHWNYFLRIFKSEGDSSFSKPTGEIADQQSADGLKFRALLSGFLSTTIQVLVIREIMTVFQGNEWMMSWTLCAWMLLTGIGVFLARTALKSGQKRPSPDGVLLLLVLFPAGLVPLLEMLKTTLFLPGMMVSPALFLVVLVLFLAPVCLLSGYIYTLLVNSLSSDGKGFSKVYTLEAAGSMVGGLIASFFFVRWFSVIQSLLILVLMVTILLAISRRRIQYYLYMLIALGAVILVRPLRLDERLKSFLLINQEVLESRETTFGNLTITQNSGQYNFFGNGTLLFSTDNTITSEEYTHYALMQHPDPKNVLLVSGGTTEMVAEILKYKSIESIDCIGLYPMLIDMAARYMPLPSDNRVHVIPGDGRRVINNSQKKYDIVIFVLPDPSSLQINRFYTDEFLVILKQKLNQGAVILYGLSSSGNYLSEEKKKIETTVFQTLKNNFLQVEILPGERDYFIASDSSLRLDMAQLSKTKGIKNSYVNASYMDDFSIRQRGSLLRESLNVNPKEIMLNHDQHPLPVYYHTLQFLSEYSSEGWLLIVIPLLILLIPLFFMRTVAAGIYLTGFTSSSFEILLLFSFQTFYGNIYSAIGLIVVIFMGGLAIGSLIGNRMLITKKHYLAAQMLLFAYALLYPIFWGLQNGIGSIFGGLLLFGMSTLVLSAIAGFQYVAGTKILQDKFTQTAPMLYSVDLIGAALGTVVISVVLLPLAGILNSCFIIGGLNLLFGIFIVLKKDWV
jgi:spermidine synthase